MALSFTFNKIKINRPKVRINKNISEEYRGKFWHKGHFWDIDVVNREDIIKDLNLNEEESLLLLDIIDNIELFAFEQLKTKNKITIPYFGKFQFNENVKYINENREKITEAIKNGANEKDVKEIRYNMWKEIDNKKKIEKDEIKKLNKIKRQVKDKYNEYSKTIDKTYADMYVWTLSLLKPIEFDQDYEDAFQRLN